MIDNHVENFRTRIVKTTDNDALRYSNRHYERKVKHYAETKVVEKAFSYVPAGATVLDAPCGAGRMTWHLAKMSYKMTAADLGAVMVKTTRDLMASERLDFNSDVVDVVNMPYKNGQFDAVICFRLFHHFPDADSRYSLVKELCRVSSRHVLISYNTSRSFSALRNRIRCALTQKRIKKYATSQQEVERYFQDNGYKLVNDFARLPFYDSLHLAVFERQ